MHWYERLIRKKIEWEERLLIRQRHILFQWIEAHGVFPSEEVIVALPDESVCFRFEAGKWRRMRRSLGGPQRFVLCSNTLFSGVQQVCLAAGEWRSIFLAPTFEVWESVSFYEEQNMTLPLRLGLSDVEKKQVLTEVRRMMGDVLSDRELCCSEGLSPRLMERQDLDVAVWVEGRICASVIMIGQSAQAALTTGVRRVFSDKRSAPLTQETLPKARIEITFMADLVFPVLRSDWQRNDIDVTKGYTVLLSQKRQQGWYLPEVHNCVSFRSLEHFLNQLALEKTGIDPGDMPECFFGQFTTSDWIESGEGVMTLAGPTEQVMQSEISHQEIRRFAESAVVWLCRSQEADGTILEQLIPGRTESGRLPALGCVGYALASYGLAFDDAPARAAAEKIWQRLAGFLEGDYQEERHDFFTLVYFLRLSLMLHKEASEPQVAFLVRSLPLFRKNPVLLLQVLSFLTEYEQRGGGQYGAIVRAEAKKAYGLFRKHRTVRSEQIALYPELVALGHSLFALTREAVWHEQALSCSAWYAETQQPDGSWPHTPGRIFAYTRGTSKVFEALSCFPIENRRMLQKSLAWLRTMQYTEEHAFFLNQAERERLIGGFRHDAFNREAWIDASAHVILGCVRLLRKKA